MRKERGEERRKEKKRKEKKERERKAQKERKKTGKEKEKERKKERKKAAGQMRSSIEAEMRKKSIRLSDQNDLICVTRELEGDEVEASTYVECGAFACVYICVCVRLCVCVCVCLCRLSVCLLSLMPNRVSELRAVQRTIMRACPSHTNTPHTHTPPSHNTTQEVRTHHR